MTAHVKWFQFRAHRHNLRRQTVAFLLALFCGMLVALLVAGFIYWIYQSDRFFR